MVLVATCTFCGARFRFQCVDEHGFEVLAAATLWRLAEFVTEHGSRHTPGAATPIWLDLDPQLDRDPDEEPPTTPGDKINSRGDSGG